MLIKKHKKSKWERALEEEQKRQREEEERRRQQEQRQREIDNTNQMITTNFIIFNMMP